MWQSLVWRPDLLTLPAPSIPTVDPSNSNFLTALVPDVLLSSQCHQNNPEIILQDPIHLSLREGAWRSFFFFFLQFFLANTGNFIDHRIFRKRLVIIWEIYTRQQNMLNDFCPSRLKKNIWSQQLCSLMDRNIHTHNLKWQQTQQIIYFWLWALLLYLSSAQFRAW